MKIAHLYRHNITTFIHVCVFPLQCTHIDAQPTGHYFELRDREQPSVGVPHTLFTGGDQEGDMIVTDNVPRDPRGGQGRAKANVPSTGPHVTPAPTNS
jgi:hypothetical protein